MARSESAPRAAARDVPEPGRRVVARRREQLAVRAEGDVLDRPDVRRCNVRTSRADATSHSFALPSQPAVASRVPSGLKARLWTRA